MSEWQPQPYDPGRHQQRIATPPPWETQSAPYGQSGQIPPQYQQPPQYQPPQSPPRPARQRATRRKIISGAITAIAFIAGIIIGNATGSAGKTAAAPAPTVTVTTTAAAAAAHPKTALSKSAPAAAASAVLFSKSGNGIYNSAPFAVGSAATVSYSYNCAAFGTSGNFTGDLETPDQSSLNSDDQSFANAIGNSGSATSTVYPQNPGQDYYVAINSECDWTVKITGKS